MLSSKSRFAMGPTRRILTREPLIRSRLGVTTAWARHASSGGEPRPSGGRILKLLVVFGVSAAAVAAYPLITKQKEEVTATKSKIPQAEIVFEKARRSAVSQEDNRDLISSQHLQVKRSWESPGVYAWGSNAGKVAAPDAKEAYIKTPRRIPYFDGHLLRDLKLDRQIGVALLENGDLVQWGSAVSTVDTAPVTTLKGKDLVQVALSQDRIVALSSNGTVYSLPLSPSEKPADEQQTGGAASRIPFWSNPTPTKSILQLKPENLGWREKVVQISSGREHCLMLTSAGRVFSAAASAESFPSQGQLGVPGLRWETRPPGLYCQPHEIRGLGGYKAVKVATGDYHSLVLDETGQVFAFGSNSAGQLGTPTDAGLSYLERPSRLPLEKLYSGSSLDPKVTTISAGGLNSFFTVDATPRQTKKDVANISPSAIHDRVVADTWACGEGLYGSLGTGRWTHGHPSSLPAKIKSLSGLSEYDEVTNKVVPIRLTHISVGSSHAAAVMDNVTNVSAAARPGIDTNWGADILFWGRNESYQLGTGKRNNENAPVYIGPLDGGKGDAAKGRKGEIHRFQITPRTTVRLGEDGKGRRISLEQKVECGRDISAVYSAT